MVEAFPVFRRIRDITFAWYIMIINYFIYIATRLTLIILMLLGLPSLSPGVYDTVTMWMWYYIVLIFKRFARAWGYWYGDVTLVASHGKGMGTSVW